MRLSRQCLAVAALLSSMLAVAQDSPLVQGRTADMWLVDPETGQVTGYDTGQWMTGVDPADYPEIVLGANDALLINTLPSSTVLMTPGQPAISLSGLGDVALLAGEGGQGGHRDLTLAPAAGTYADTIAVTIGVSSSLLAENALDLSWSAVDVTIPTSPVTVVDNSANLRRGAGNSGANGYHYETFYLTNTGDYVVTVNLVGPSVNETETANYELLIEPGRERRDTDGDGIPDAVEVDMGLNPLNNDWMADTDGNGWSEFDEWLRRFCLDPVTKQPLDGATQCLDANGVPLDSDLDDWSDFDEILRGTNHLDPEPVIPEQVGAPPANLKEEASVLEAPTQVNDALFCTDGSTFWFDLRFHADADDSISNDIILGVGADSYPFSNPNHSIRVNFGELGQITRQAPIVRTGTTPEVTPLERWKVGPIDDFTIESVGVEEWHVYGSVPVGADPFAPGDVVSRVAIRSNISGESGGANYTISGNPSDCDPGIAEPAPAYTEYEARQRLRFKDYPAANRLYEIEHLVDSGQGMLVIPPTANIQLDQQSAGSNEAAYTGIVVQTVTPSQNNIAGVDIRVDAGGEGVEDIILNIWSGALRTGELLLSHRVEDVDRDGDPARVIPVRFEPVAVQPGQPVYLEFRKSQAALVSTGADTMAGGGVIEVDGNAASGQTDLLLDVYYDANFSNGIGGTRAGFQWWTVAAEKLDATLAYDATLLLRDDEIAAAGLTPADISPRRHMTSLANALGSNQLPEMRLPAGDSVVVSAVHRHHVPDQEGWRAPADYSRIYKRWLGRLDDLTPTAMLEELGEGAWTTPEEWRREFIAYLAPRIVVPVSITLDERSTLEVAVVEAALSEEARLDGTGGIQIINGIFQPGQPIYTYQPGQPQYGNLVTHQSPYVDSWEDNLVRLATDDFNLDQSIAAVTVALGAGQPLEELGAWMRERFYAGEPGTSSDKYMAQQFMSAFPDVCKVPTPDIAARQADVDGWNEFLDQCPAWVDDAGFAQYLEAMRDRCYQVRLNLLPSALTEIASDATLLERELDSDGDGASNRVEIEQRIQALTLPWLFDSDGDSIADDVDPCPNDEYNDCSSSPIYPNVTINDDFAVYEPATGSDFALISVQLDRMYDVPVTVCYEAVVEVGDTATADADFQVATGCVTIESGQMTALIEIPINADGELDAGETFTVRITSISNGQIADDGIVVVTINDPLPTENSAPIFTSEATAVAASGSTDTGYTATVFDADGDTVTFSISGGADAAAFSIDSSSGVLSFVVAPNVDLPGDANGDNAYEVQLAADDGNGGSATLDLLVTVVGAQIDVEVSFPTPGSNLGGGITSLTVRGNVVDPLGESINEADISSITVNGVPATLDAGIPGRWSASLPLVEGTTTLTTTLTRSDNSTSIVTLDIENFYLHLGMSDIEMDTANNRAFVLDGAADAVLEVDLASGERSVVTLSGDGNSPNFTNPTGIAYDAANNRVLIADQGRDAIVQVDLGTGARSDVTRLGSVGAGTGLQNPWDVTLDLANNRLLVVDLGLNALVTVDLATGDRAIFSDAATGTGPNIDTPRQVILDSAGNRALVVDGTLRALVAIDLATGDRTILSDSSTGTGPALFNPNDFAFDPTTGLLVVADQTAGLISVDLDTGNRTLLDRPNLDFGLNASRLQGVGLDLINNRLIASDSNVDAIFTVDLATTERSVLSDSSTGTIDEPAILTGIQGMTYAADANKVFVVDSYKKVIWQVDLATAHRTRLSDNVTGSGPGIDFPGRMDVDSANGVAYYLEQNVNTLNAVDLETGDRVIVSGSTVGTGPAFAAVTDVALDLANGRAFVTDWGINALFLVDLATGDRTIVSDANTGTGTMPTTPQAVGWDSVNGRAVIADFGLDILLGVDAVTGDRTVLANNTGVGSGSAFSVPFDIEIDAANDRAIVPDYGIDQILGVNLSSGDRVNLHPQTDILQLNLQNPYFIAADLPNDRVFIYDVALTGITVLDLTTGERAVISK